MIRGMFSAASGMQATTKKMDVISNNLSNSATTGFKASRAEFKDIFSAIVRAPGVQNADGTVSPVGIQIGHGVMLSSVAHDFAQGSPIQASTDPKDVTVMISGQGFFKIQLPDGQTGYTRDGTFHLDKTGQIVTADGYPVEGPTSIPSNASVVSINQNGTVSYTDPSAPPQNAIVPAGHFE
ncbi:MAG: flagellar hook-basal body complex protein, partial [Magnetococcales bacterium]|nr:flagellar hook-basal body complex protein [Magnetococcales bacterium]